MRSSHWYALILAGGIGTRLWPISRVARPKQHLALFGRQTLLQATYERARAVFSSDHIFVATHESEIQAVRCELPRVAAGQILAEPAARGTGAAIGFGALSILHRDPKAILATVNSDAFVLPARRFVRALRAALARAEEQKHTLSIIGIPPTYPETGYGYIVAGELLGRAGGFPVYAVRRFCEKPAERAARAFVSTRAAYWNTTVLVATGAHVLALYAKHLPRTYRLLAAMGNAFERGGQSARVRSLFKKLPRSDINVGILQKERALQVLVARGVRWADVGHWRSVADISQTWGGARPSVGPVVALDSPGVFVVSHKSKLIAAVGVRNLCIVDTPDALLVCSRDKTSAVKALVSVLRRKGLTQYL